MIDFISFEISNGIKGDWVKRHGLRGLKRWTLAKRGISLSGASGNPQNLIYITRNRKLQPGDQGKIFGIFLAGIVYLSFFSMYSRIRRMMRQVVF